MAEEAGFIQKAGIVLLIVLASIFLHESGHYLSAQLFGLEPQVILGDAYIAIAADPGTVPQNQLINNLGPLVNLAAVLVLFSYFVFRSRFCSSLDDNICFFIVIAIFINLLLAMADLLQPLYFLSPFY